MTASHRSAATTHPATRSPIRIAACIAAVCFAALCGAHAPAQDTPTASNCAPAQHEHSCSVASLKQAVDSAKTFWIHAAPRDRIGASQLRSLGASLGKSFALANQPADLTFVLTSVESGGVNYGSMDRALATLTVYGPGGERGDNSLLWVETFSGQPDLPWAAVVRQLTEKFRDRLK